MVDAQVEEEEKKDSDQIEVEEEQEEEEEEEKELAPGEFPSSLIKPGHFVYDQLKVLLFEGVGGNVDGYEAHL